MYVGIEYEISSRHIIRITLCVGIHMNDIPAIFHTLARESPPDLLLTSKDLKDPHHTQHQRQRASTSSSWTMTMLRRRIVGVAAAVQ